VAAAKPGAFGRLELRARGRTVAFTDHRLHLIVEFGVTNCINHLVFSATFRRHYNSIRFSYHKSTTCSACSRLVVHMILMRSLEMIVRAVRIALRFLYLDHDDVRLIFGRYESAVRMFVLSVLSAMS
jgi:hypothetical protein